MQTRVFLLAAALLTAVPVLPAPAQDMPATPPAVTDTPVIVPDATGVTLRYKFTPGQSRAYKFTMDSDGMLMGGPGGQGLPIKQHMDAIMRQTVKDVRASDGAATIEVGYQGMKMTMNGQPMPAPPQTGADGKPLPPDAVQQVVTIVMTPMGKVLSVTNAAGDAGGPLGSMNNLFQSVNNAAFPEGPIKAGDKWDSKSELAAMGLNVASANVVVAADANSAHYTTTMTGTMDSAAGTAPTPLPLNLAGTLAGTTDQTFDVAAGALTSQTGTINLDLNMTPKQDPGADAPAGATPMKLKMKVTTHMDQMLVAPKPATP